MSRLKNLVGQKFGRLTVIGGVRMARRRCISLDIIDTDKFLDMPASTQALYMHLVVRADDDGFVGKPKRLIRMLGLSEGDLRLLCSEGFLIPFESGVVYINHFKKMNLIQNDRYKPTIYTSEYDEIKKNSNKKLSEYGVLGKPGFLYVILSNKNLCKIGISRNPDIRILSIKNSERLDIVNKYVTEKCFNSREIEKLCHTHFSNKRVRGEWFDIEYDEAVDYLKKIFVKRAKK